MSAIVARVYGDYTCPFSFLAEFPLERAIAAASAERPELAVRIENMPFELRPEPNPTLRIEDLTATWNSVVLPIARSLRVPLRMPSTSPQPHTHLAHEGFQFAKEHGLERAWSHRVHAAFFQDDLDIGSVDVLLGLGIEIGLPVQPLRQALESRRYRDAHVAALVHAYRDAHVRSVPLIVIGEERFEGVKSVEELREALIRADV